MKAFNPNKAGAFGPNYLYSDAMDECTLCETPIKMVPAVGIYLVDTRGAIHYPMCKVCAANFKNGLPSASMRVLDMKLEKRAVELGLAQTH